MIQPLAPGKVDFKPRPAFSKSQEWRVHSPSGMLPQGCTTRMGKGWWGVYVFLKTSENFPLQLICPPFGHLCGSLQLQQGDGVRKGALSPLPTSPWATMAIHPSYPYKTPGIQVLPTSNTLISSAPVPFSLFQKGGL